MGYESKVYVYGRNNNVLNFDYDCYTVKCITPKGNIYLGHTIAPKIRNAVQYVIDNYKNDLFCKEIIGIAHGYITDINSPFFKSVKNNFVQN